MASITEQKADARAMLHKRCENYLAAHPDMAPEIAMQAIRRLSKKCTLRELADWHIRIITLAPEMSRG